MNVFFLVLALIAVVMELLFTFKIFFGSLQGYVDAWISSFKAIISFHVRDDWGVILWNRIKLAAYHAGGLVAGFAVYYGLMKHFG